MDEVVSKPEPARPTFAAPLVVGVGASAGGLEALSALLRELPVDAPLGVVVLQHLDPELESSLTELLTRQTAFKVMPLRATSRATVLVKAMMPPLQAE